MREKLIELVAEKDMECNYMDCCKCEYFKTKRCKASMIADHLIANGVTIQKWIPVTERLPETTCTNLVSCGEAMFLAYYDGKQWRSSGTLRVVPVKHWMPLPEPPKGISE